MARPRGKKKQVELPQKLADSVSKFIDETSQFITNLDAFEKERADAKSIEGQKIVNKGKKDDENKGDDRDGQSEHDKDGDDSGSDFDDFKNEALRGLIEAVLGIQKDLRDVCGTPEESRSTEAARHAKHEPTIAIAQRDDLSKSPQLSLAGEADGQGHLPRNSEIDDAPDPSAGYTSERR